MYCVFIHPIYSYVLCVYTSCMLICPMYLYILYAHTVCVFIHVVHANLYSYLFCSVEGDKNTLFATTIAHKSTRPTAPAHTEWVTWLANRSTVLVIPYWTTWDTLPTSITEIDLEIATLLAQERSLWCGRSGEVKRIEVVLRVCMTHWSCTSDTLLITTGTVLVSA